MDPAQYKTVILMPVVKLYARPDRGTRMALLEALPEYEGKLDEKTVQDTIWPHFQTGFADTVPVIREATVKAVSVLAPKFSSRILNNDLLRHLAKAQSDPEPSIRTNTCILIARLAPSLSAITKKKVLIPAFSKALKDPFVHARVAGVMGLTACVESFDIEDAATKVLGIIGSGLIDKEKIVRDPAFKCLESYRAKVQAYADSMPETALLPDGSAPAASITSYTGQAPSDLLSAATGVAGGVAGWAFESISSRLVSRDAPTKPGAAVTVSAPITPALNTETKTVIPTPSPTASVRSVPSSKVGTKGKGMALGSKLGTKGGQAALMAELEKEMQKDETEFANAWGDDDPYASNAPNGQADLGGDLMDVNADQDDWTPFESASPQTANPTIKSLRSIVQADNPWQLSTDDLAAAFNKPTTYSTLSTQVGGMSQSPNSPTPAKQRLGAVSAQSTYSNTVPSTPSTAQSPTMASKSTDDWGGFGASDMVAVDTDKVETSKSASASSTGNLAGMTKEEKAAEMARRREERKARIAQLKEQKKGGT
ncbi:hypothetical protein FRC20_011315 [Serendipita sp. 405]|nr:hypothetical protein FRC20_011315 [Serendipita sp. 405]